MKLKVGLDIDGVVSDSFPVFLKELNRYYGKDVKEITNYDMSGAFGVDWDDMSRFFCDHMEFLFSAPKPMKGAVEGINCLLEAGHEIIYVTARSCGAEEKVTYRWFKNNNIYMKKAYFTGGATKKEVVRENAIDVFVDDVLTNAEEIASLGVPVLLMDSPYNQGELPQGVIRCYSWDDILWNIDEMLRSRSVKSISRSSCQ